MHIKQYSRVQLVDGAVGDVVEVFTDSSEGYLIDTADADPAVPLPPDWLRTVSRSQVAEILWEPED